ncbi:aspartyl-phosphate phosphatase Spo0E family protein [Bacillus piscicola]|uniref:aspartyl-phosphate phosphatase Spo0E family protein n=1 Tax=Bacillus piscicola TaxID=1632684 RepID=UPI001F089E2F|nr:aspartyl-phosphate phosphatase Spo0E family protein [Bacillus piscicola]
MPTKKGLLREIETKREHLNTLAWEKPLFSKEVVQLSKELDDLLNKYDNNYRTRQGLVNSF